MKSGRMEETATAVKIGIVLALSFALAGCSRQAPQQEQAAVKPVITQFYASTPVIAKGQPATLCYGVESAVKVEVDPPVEQLTPSLTRCFEVKPAATTKYTLKAESRTGAVVTQTTTVTVGGAAPKLIDTSVNKISAKPGEEITVCWKAQNATQVSASPGKYLRGGIPEKDCVTDRPQRTTTYNVVVRNAEGLEDRAAVTVQVK